MKTTPSKLEEGQIFVFGSNMNGNHAGGAARTAVKKFGAIEGQATGLQGQSYALPTLSKKMQKLSLSTISKHIDELYKYAYDNADLEFIVTKIGCGIAEFEESEIAELFKSKETPFNVILPVEFLLVRGFKGFDKGMNCCGFQFDENKEFIHKGNVATCQSGFHFCEHPFDVFNFYRGNDKDFAEVEGSGKIDFDSQNSKVAVSNLKVKTKLKLFDSVKIGIEYTNKKVNFLRRRADKYIEKNTSNSSVNSGLISSVSAGRFDSEINLDGKNSFGIAGKSSKIRGKKGCAICLVEYNNNYDIIGVKTAIIDGVIPKEDTHYKLVNGEFVEA
ncbi:A1S_2505 family phage non-structural protein [Sphingobacterium siyangense]|uniref:A1S_2505 family phage non-structural protein n=1 Tax=Sphingobacterium siyangense TaxID=459529 RepID=UPI003C751838